jgi:hypothetical protein
MASITSSAKSGSDWTQTELDAYDIRISFQNDALTFFNTPALPQAEPLNVNQRDLDD